jgi:hypothetical protein
MTYEIKPTDPSPLEIIRELHTEIAALKAERDDAVKAGRIFDACRQHAEEECAKLWAALEGIVKALEDGEERGFLHMHIVTALDIARRALEGK